MNGAACIIFLLLEQGLAQYTALPRWGQAAVIVNDNLIVHGGRTDQYNYFTYTSAPPINDILSLSLSSSFTPSSPPWQLVSSSNTSSSQGPALAWHTLSAIDTTEILLFGGEVGPNSPTVLPGGDDSATILAMDSSLNPTWITKAASWANEPVRRMRHSASSVGGKVFLIGGEKTDGSNLAFSTHYLFDNDTPSFTALPSSNGPPDVSDHASVVLDNGLLLVFGGYSPSQAALLPLTTIWVMDTTQSTLQWSSVSVVSSNTPSPRRAFATALLNNGNIIVHGGSDAEYQNTYSDGWILDTTKTPMTWSQAPGLTQLGPRRDHFAVPRQNMVIFGFGYGANSAAPADLQIYDASSDTWLTTFTPPASDPSSTSASQSVTGTGTGSRTTSPTSSGHSSPTTSGHHQESSGSPSGAASSPRTALAVGATLGVLALIAGGAAALYYTRRRGAIGGRQFHVLGGRWHRHRPSDGSSNFGGPIPVIGAPREKRPGVVTGDGRGWFSKMGFLESNAARRERKAQERRDILADEDTRQFWTGSYYGLEGGMDADVGTGSTWSLRNVGTMIGERMGILTREPSTQSGRSTLWREKSDPFSDGAALMTTDDHGASTSRPHHGRHQSYSSARSARSYIDPFSDPIIEEPREDYLYHDIDANAHTKDSTRSRHVYPSQLPPLDTTISASLRPHKLSPLTEQTSHNTVTESVHDGERPVSPFNGSSDVTSMTSMGDKSAATMGIRHPSSLVGANPPPDLPIRRSDTWWARFARTSFLDRKSSDGGRGGRARMLDIRDPNPAPRLVAIEEAPSPQPELVHSPSGDSDPEATVEPKHSRVVYGGDHGKSMSSLKTMDTIAIERMGGMDVVQHAVTSSRESTMSTVDGPLLMLADGEDGQLVSARVEMPTRRLSLVDISRMSSWWSSSQPRTASPPYSPIKSGEGVAARVQEYERRMSMSNSPPLSPVNTRQREERLRKPGVSVNYGLVPKPSLFVANPDARQGSSSSSASS